MSDSINQVGGGVSGSQATGDLPGTVNVVQDAAGGTDEGRAMAEIVYDGAPGITQMTFATGLGGAASRAGNIGDLADAGVDVIADDIANFTEPFFQDGIVTQAADAAAEAGVAYLASAGNRARQSWEGTYAPTADPRGVSPSTEDFDPGPGTDPVQTIGTFTNRTAFVSLQWDEAWGQASTDLAIDVYSNADTSPVYAFTLDSDNIATGLPSEAGSITITGTVSVGIGIRRLSGGRNPFMKYLVNGVPTFTIAEYPTNSPVINPGATAARGALSVGASNFATPQTPEIFSSRGPLRRLFDAGGTRLASPEIRQKPNLAAADGVSTTVTGFETFSGTSAAMPFGVLRAIMTNPGNALPCTASAGVPDNDCGSGFILADAAVQQALDSTPPTVSSALTPASPNGSKGFYTSNPSVSWNVGDPDSPVVATGCGDKTVRTNGTTKLVCSATSAGGTTTREVKVKRDASAPTKPKIKGIKRNKKYDKSKLPKKKRIKCKSTDKTSGIKSCRIKGYSKRAGRHKLKATAVNGAGLSSKATLKYKVKGGKGK
jgi:hypothetical protein